MRNYYNGEKMENKLLEIVNRLENIVDRNSNYIEDVSIDLKEDLALESYNELERKINEIKKMEEN